MPIFYQQDIDENTRLGVWQITEPEAFFLEAVPLHRNITHPHKRLQHLAGRYLLQFLYPDFPIALIQVADTRKPYLADEAYHFSISHCDEFAAVIVSKKARVGIDIETVSEKVERISSKFLHLEERAGISTNAEQRLKELTLRWCGKEAVYKWWSFGKVDFSEQIRIDGFSAGGAGVMQARFIKEGEVGLEISYRQFPGVCLAWTVGVV